MAEFPWQSHSRAAPERDYLALLSYLPLNSGWSIPRLLLYNARIRRQLRTSVGLVGYSLPRHQAVLDTLRMGGRDGAAGVRRGAAACRRHEGVGPS
jgi:hypothetical protein